MSLDREMTEIEAHDYPGDSLAMAFKDVAVEYNLTVPA